MNTSLDGIIHSLSTFTGRDLTQTLNRIENGVRAVSVGNCTAFLRDNRVDREIFAAAVEMKRLAAQIDVKFHALGILLCLPHILKPGEEIESVSLGAGNTGKDFDLKTSHRIAEFKFIRWQKRGNAVREEAIFKDYVKLQLAACSKPGHKYFSRRKYLYLLDREQAVKFLQTSERRLKSVFGPNLMLSGKFFAEPGNSRFQTVKDYYQHHRDAVQIINVTQWLCGGASAGSAGRGKAAIKS